MKLMDLVFDLTAFFFRRGREINTGDKSITGKILYIKESSEPAVPPTGYCVLWYNSSNELWVKTDGGVSTKLN